MPGRKIGTNVGLPMSERCPVSIQMHLWRTTHHLTQKEFSSEFGMNSGTYASWENSPKGRIIVMRPEIIERFKKIGLDFSKNPHVTIGEGKGRRMFWEHRVTHKINKLMERPYQDDVADIEAAANRAAMKLNAEISICNEKINHLIEKVDEVSKRKNELEASWEEWSKKKEGLEDQLRKLTFTKDYLAPKQKSIEVENAQTSPVLIGATVPV